MYVCMYVCICDSLSQKHIVSSLHLSVLAHIHMHACIFPDTHICLLFFIFAGLRTTNANSRDLVQEHKLPQQLYHDAQQNPSSCCFENTGTIVYV